MIVLVILTSLLLFITLYFVYSNCSEESKPINKDVNVSNSSEHLSPKRLTLKMISLLKSLNYNKAVYFDGFCILYREWANSKGRVGSDKFNFSGDMFVYFDSYYMDDNAMELLGLHYPNIEEDKRVEHFIERLVTVGVVKDVPYHTLEKLLKPFIGERTYRGKQWVSIGDGEYYADSYYKVYRFSDWKSFSSFQALKLIEGLEIKPCEDPEKTHWKHFLEIRMKAKKQREKDCSEFIDKILHKQQEYNDLQYKYEMLPSAPITDYESFCNFCKIVKEDVIFADYEITNMLLLKRKECCE